MGAENYKAFVKLSRVYNFNLLGVSRMSSFLERTICFYKPL